MSNDEVTPHEQQDQQEHDEQQAAAEQLVAFVVQEVKSGSDKALIVQKLVEQGLDHTQAEGLVGQIHEQVMELARAEQWTLPSLMPALLGGAVAAVVGGAIWGAIVSATDYEIGFMAWGVGLLSGVAVVLLAHGRRGFPLQLIAVASSIAGIIIGKYLTFYFVFRDYVIKEYGQDKADQLSMFSGKMIQAFAENLSNILSGYDILWVVLALVTAWKIPKGSGVKVPAYPTV